MGYSNHSTTRYVCMEKEKVNELIANSPVYAHAFHLAIAYTLSHINSHFFLPCLKKIFFKLLIYYDVMDGIVNVTPVYTFPF